LPLLFFEQLNQSIGIPKRKESNKESENEKKDLQKALYLVIIEFQAGSKLINLLPVNKFIFAMMIGQLTVSEKTYKFNLNSGFDISIPISRNAGVSSFGIARADYRDYESGGFIGNKSKGGACNLETVTFTAHGNGTHTECLGHISSETYYVNDCIHDRFMLAELISVKTKDHKGDQVLDFSNISLAEMEGLDALILRTFPNEIEKENKDYSGNNAPYILPEDMKELLDHGIQHLLIDLPSVDKEWDAGVLASHHIYWNYPANPRIDASITEFIYIDDFIKDGIYVLKLNISGFESDAAPSKPMIYSLS
jgi:hypothetical protein